MRKGFHDGSNKPLCLNQRTKFDLLDWSSRVCSSEASAINKVDSKWSPSRQNNFECDYSISPSYCSSGSSSLKKPKEIANIFNPVQSERLSRCNLKATKTGMKVSDDSNMSSVRAAHSSKKPMVDCYVDCKWAHKDSESFLRSDQYNLDGELSEELSSSCQTKPLFQDQKRSFRKKRTMLSKSRKRSTMSIIRERSYKCGDFFGCPSPMDDGDGGNKHRASLQMKVACDTKSNHFVTQPTVKFTRTTEDGGRERTGQDSKKRGFTLDEMGVGRGELNIEGFCAPPKTDIYEALYRRVASFHNPDIFVFIDSYKFRCHKSVLQCYSRYFEELDNESEVEIEGVTKEAFVAIYNWMLAPDSEGLRFIQKNNILDVLIASKILVIKELENQCLAFIDSKEAFSEENAFLLFIDASRRKQNDIMELMVPRIQVFFLVLVCSVEFLELEVEDLCVLLQSNYIVVHCEKEVFMAAVRWLMAEWAERSKALVRVMQCIRFGLMPSAQLIDIRKNPMSPEFIDVTSDKSVQMMIEDGLAYSVVEHDLTGQTDQHTQRCELLKIKIPQPRNWAKNNKEYKSYEDFLNFLDEVSKNPQAYYIEARGTIQRNDAHRSNGKCNAYSNSEEGDMEIDRSHVNYINPRTKRPSLSDLLCKEKTKQISTNVPDAYEIHHNKGRKTGRVCDDQPHHNTLKQSPVSEEDFSCRKSTKRMTLKEGAAIIIQATFRGHAVRKRMLKARENSAKERQSAQRQTFDNMFLRVKKNVSDKEISIEDDRSLKHTGRATVEKKLEVEGVSSTESNESIVSVKERPGSRKSMASSRYQSILIFGGVNPSSKHHSAQDAGLIYRYSLEKNAWENVDMLPSPRYYHGTALLKGRLYVVGGCCPVTDVNLAVSLSTVNFSYDPVNKTWNREPGLKTPRRNFGLVVLGNHLYAIGGQDANETILSSVERFDPVRRLWEEVASLPEPTIGAAICVHKNHIWLTGGMNGSATNFRMSKEVWCYDPRQDLWAKKGPLRFARAFASLNSYDGYLFLVGGITSENSAIVSNDHIDVWDGETWKLKGNIDPPRHGHSVAFLGSLMLILGGVSTNTVKGLTRVDSLCMMSGSRSKQIAALPSPLVGHSCLLLPPMNG